MSKKRSSVFQEIIRGDTAELVETAMTKKVASFFQGKIEGWHSQLPPLVSPTLVTLLHCLVIQTPISKSADRRLAKGVSIVGFLALHTKLTPIFCLFLPQIFTENKMLKFACEFNPSRIWIALVFKRNNIIVFLTLVWKKGSEKKYNIYTYQNFSRMWMTLCEIIQCISVFFLHSPSRWLCRQQTILYMHEVTLDTQLSLESHRK